MAHHKYDSTKHHIIANGAGKGITVFLKFWHCKARVGRDFVKYLYQSFYTLLFNGNIRYSENI